MGSEYSSLWISDEAGIYLQLALNDASGGVPSMLHDCDLSLSYVAKWRVPGGQQHHRMYCGNCAAKSFLLALMVYSMASAFFYFWASFEDCIVDAGDGELGWILFGYAWISIFILTLQGAKYIFWFRNETDGGLEKRGAEIDDDRRYQAVSSLTLVIGVIQALALIQLFRTLLSTTDATCTQIIMVRWFVISQVGLFGALLCLLFTLRALQVKLVKSLLPVEKLKKQQDDAQVALAVGDMRKFEEKNRLTSNSQFNNEHSKIYDFE